VDRNTTQRGLTMIVMSVTAIIVLVFNLSVYFTPVSAGTIFSETLCGDGSAPDYGFTYDLQQAHWTVGWQDYVSEQAVTEVDTVLDRLNEDSIAQTMILIKPQNEVGKRANCAAHFLRYMKLGEPAGERKDNGFVFLIVVEPSSIDVHYGVGLGLPALTAPELTNLNRAAEDTYQSTHSMDQALLTLVHGFNTVARDKYAPLISPAATQDINGSSALPSGPAGILNICGLLCMGIFFLLFLLWMFSQMGRTGINFNPSGSGSWGRGFSPGAGRSSPPSRGGSGSGRSGRAN
jgi:hypothetical protein